MQADGITLILKPARDLNSLGAVDRAIGTYKTALYKFLKQRNTSIWVDKVQEVADAVNSRVHSTVGAPPDEVEGNEMLSLLILQKNSRNLEIKTRSARPI